MKGHGWVPPETDLINAKEIWITEGVLTRLPCGSPV